MISTHAPLAGRDAVVVFLVALGIYISTHAPLAGRDLSYQHTEHNGTISTHAPLAGRDKTAEPADTVAKIFQPTRPLRGATCESGEPLSHRKYFNPRAPCGARQSGEGS